MNLEIKIGAYIFDDKLNVTNKEKYFKLLEKYFKNIDRT